MSAAPLTAVLVDDAPEVRALVRTHLRLSGRFSVVGEGATGADAVDLAGRHRPDLLLLDVSMPGVDGLDALPGIRETSPATRVVLFSGFDARGLADRGRELGAVGFLEKSLPVDRLADELLALLAASADAADRPGPRADREPDGDGDTGPVPAPHRGDVLGEDLERFREVFDQAAIGMATMTLAGRVVRANSALGAIVGRPAEDLVGTAYEDLVETGDAAPLRALADRLGRGDTGVGHLEHGVRDAVGRRVAATVSVVRGRDERPLYLFLQAQDVSAERRVDERLRQSEERFRLLVEAVEDYAIFMLDPEGHVASWNAGAQRIKGYAAAEILGQHFRVFYPPERQAERHPEHELRIALRDGHYQEEGRRVRKDGSIFWAHVVITAVHNAAGQHLGFAKVTRDITERRFATDQREHAAAALAQAKDELEVMNDRLVRAAADQSQFLAVTAHELRTPVAVLGGSAGTLAAHWRELDDAERTELFAGMVSSAARLRRLLADLLTAARLEAGAVELSTRPVPLGDVLAAAVGTARQGRAAEDVVLRADPGLVAVADGDRLAQAVDNLVGNALRHGTPPVRVTASGGATTVEIRVSDAGPGVPAGIRPQLFERFATGERRGGTGLGLFIVRELARAQGGDAWYEDGPPPTFVLSLPRA